jgi:hypothetical protein
MIKDSLGVDGPVTCSLELQGCDHEAGSGTAIVCLNDCLRITDTNRRHRLNPSVLIIDSFFVVDMLLVIETLFDRRLLFLISPPADQENMGFERQEIFGHVGY